MSDFKTITEELELEEDNELEDTKDEDLDEEDDLGLDENIFDPANQMIDNELFRQTLNELNSNRIVVN